MRQVLISMEELLCFCLVEEGFSPGGSRVNRAARARFGIVSLTRPVLKLVSASRFSMRRT